MKSERQAIIGQKIIWSVISNSDLQEGKGAAVIVGNNRTETEANLAAEGKGAFGTKAEVRCEELWVVESIETNSFYLLGDKISEYIDMKVVKETALKKLTKLEKKALGLDDEKDFEPYSE